jgi:hypothetical protein
MSTVKPVNFPRIHTGVTPASQTSKGDKLRQLQKGSSPQKASGDRSTPKPSIENEPPSEQVTLHASQARVLKLYEPNMVTIKQPAKLGQVIDIKI